MGRGCVALGGSMAVGHRAVASRWPHISRRAWLGSCCWPAAQAHERARACFRLVHLPPPAAHPSWQDKIMNFEITLKPDEGLYK